MTTLQASDARIPTDVYMRVAYQNEAVRVERRSSPSIYLISEADRNLLQEAKRRVLFEQAANRAADEYGDVLKRLAD